jgi:hypothetical protein
VLTFPPFGTVPFEEDAKSSADGSGVFFLDQNYHENMWEMFRKVSGT